jgi:hypothetical protein
MVVAVLLVVVLAAVLVPPAVRAHEARRDAFLVSFGQDDAAEALVLSPRRSPQVERRRQTLGGLLIAVAGTGLVGLVPTFRTLLVVHLFLVDALLGYVALLAHLGDRRAREPWAAPGVSGATVPGQLQHRPAAFKVLNLPHPVRSAPRRPMAADLPPAAAG